MTQSKCGFICTVKVSSFPGRLPLHSLDRIRDLWTTRRSGRSPGITSTSSNLKVMSYVDSVSSNRKVMTYVDLVSVIMATCLHTLLHVLASTT